MQHTQEKSNQQKVEKIWKKSYESCEFSLISHDQREKWLIDSGCSKNMTGDKRKFLQLNEYEKGNVNFGNDTVVPIRGKRTIILDKKTKTQNMLYVDGLKHNILNVSLMCGNGHEVTLKSK